MAWKEYYVYNMHNTSLTAGLGTAFEDTVIRLDSDADFEAMKFHHIATSDQIFVKYSDDAYGRQLQNTGLDLRMVSGTRLFTSGVVDVGIHPNNFMPMILTRPFLIRAATTFTASFSDFSNASNSIYLSMHGAKLRKDKAPWDKKWNATPPFWYAGSATLSASGSASFGIALNIDSHFLIKKITGTRTGPCLINIVDSSTDRAWMDRPMHIDNIMGNAQFPNILPAPRFAYRGSVISIQLTDLSGAANTVRLVFHGEKLF